MGAETLLNELRARVGRNHVLTRARAKKPYCKGFRFGGGDCLAVVRPGSLVAMWRVLELCVAADVIVIMQASNTGLTGGSTPQGSYNRDAVIISTRRLNGVRPIRCGTQVLCWPGATLYELERVLYPLGREPHSVIGSSCIGASVVGGVCNNSGGALVRRGPAYTEMALFAQVSSNGQLRLVNRLGIDLGNNPEKILERLDRGDFNENDIADSGTSVCSDQEYVDHVRNVEADTPARFNADPRRLRDASGSAGKVATFMVRLDTFPADKKTHTFYIGTDDSSELETIRRRILTDFCHLPVSAEYIHKDAFAIAERYGKDTYLAIRYLGTDKLPLMFKLKNLADMFVNGLGDRVLQGLSRIHPPHLPQRLRRFGLKYEHQLILQVTNDGVDETRSFLESWFPSRGGDMFECDSDEASAAKLHRFAVAGAAIRYRSVHKHKVGELVALDVALRRNDPDWFERLPPQIAKKVLHRLYYGHFLCHVLHQDYLLHVDADPIQFKNAVLQQLDARGAEYPAEHNVGHLYEAKPALATFYTKLDPTNIFNPGIGKTSREKYWQ